MHRGYVKLYRKSLDHALFKKPLVWHFLNYCIIRANHKDNETVFSGKPFSIKRGSFIMSLSNAARDTGLTVQNIRSAIKALENFKIIEKSTKEVTKQATIITVCKYELYQSKKETANKATNTPLTKEQQGANKVLTTDNNVKELKNEKECSSSPLNGTASKLLEEALKKCRDKLGISDIEFTTLYGTCHDAMKLSEAVQIAVEASIEKYKRGDGVLDNPTRYISKVYHSESKSKITREKLIKDLDASGRMPKSEVFDILALAVNQPTEEAMWSHLKKTDEEIHKAAKGCHFLFEHKQKDFDMIWRGYK